MKTKRSEFICNHKDQIRNDPSSSNYSESIEEEFLQSTRSKNILSFGDSHGRIFSNNKFIKDFFLQAQTAYNINNPNSIINVDSFDNNNGNNNSSTNGSNGMMMQ